MLVCRVSRSEELEKKGKELDLQAWAPRAGRRAAVGVEKASGLLPSFSWSRSRPPTCQRQGHSDSFPFHPGKPPPCPHPHPGLWGPEEEAWSPQGQAPAHTPGWPGPWDFGGHVSLGEERRHVALQPTLGPGPGWRLPFLGTCCGLVWMERARAVAWCGRSRDPGAVPLPGNLGSVSRQAS